MEKMVSLKNFRVFQRRLEVAGEPTFEDCEEFGSVLPMLSEDALPFSIGDFKLYVDRHHPEKSSQLFDPENGWNERTLGVYTWVCERIPVENRYNALSFTHHRAVAALDPVDQRKWLEAANNGDGGKQWTVNRLVDALKTGEDAKINGWFILVNCGSDKMRKQFIEYLAGKALEIKSIDKRTVESKKKKPKKEITARRKGKVRK